jgi:GAF domain-containing protein
VVSSSAAPVSGWGGDVKTERKMRLWGLVVAHADGVPVAVEHVGAIVMSAAGVDAVAVAMVLSASPRETIYASDRVASAVEELTLTVGEGPGVDALADGPALVADLPAAVLAGVRAVFALPLRLGAIRLGVLALYRAAPGGLGREQMADALMLADTMGALLLDEAGRERPRPDIPWLEYGGAQHPVVHQATGMIIVQLGVTAAVALVRLRAYAYAHDRRLRDVAADVVARRLRFDPDPEGGEDRGGR